MLKSSKFVDNTPKWIHDCKTCTAIWNHFLDQESIHETNLGSIQDGLSTSCCNHKPVVQRFIDHAFPGNSPKKKKLEESQFQGVISSKGGRGQSVQMTEHATEFKTSWNILLQNKSSIPGHPGKGRVLDPNWVDLDILKKWKHTCLSSHGSKCQNPLKVWPTRPAWLIDVEKGYLVRGHISGDYIALSYTYANRRQRSIDADILARLQKPHALHTPELSEFLTPIIEHAMYLTSAIGEHYLWVDAICISQDDPVATTEQLKLMGAIYANAIITIIAADGGPDSGLVGLQGVSGPRKLNQKIIPFGEEQLIVRNTRHVTFFPFLTSRTLPYYTRGWTYQEYRMAKRKIIFDSLELHWECECSVWHEELVLNTEIDGEFRQRFNIIMAGFPDYSSISTYILEYNKRQFRYDEDALPAITGLLAVLSRSFQGGFLYGIPEMFFERGLGWQPYLHREDLRRRNPSERSKRQQLTPSDLPSWSWLGWQGWTDAGCENAIRVNQNPFVEETIPITEWFTSQFPTDRPEQRRRIRSTWYENRDIYKDFTKPMPPGWTRYDAPRVSPRFGGPHIYPEGCGTYVFKHEALLEHNGEPVEWFYPFPVTDIQESTLPFTPEQTQYLFCETTTARLHGYRQEFDSPDNYLLGVGMEYDVKLYNSSSEDIGKLHLVSKETWDRFPEFSANGSIGCLVELVAVCKLRSCSKTYNRNTQEHGFPIVKGNLYLVLWIEWKDGIAYRVASGRVRAEKWDQLDTQSISLVLG